MCECTIAQPLLKAGLGNHTLLKWQIALFKVQKNAIWKYTFLNIFAQLHFEKSNKKCDCTIVLLK